MKEIRIGRRFDINLRVGKGMTAKFFDCEIHKLYSTFEIVKHAEYTGRMAIMQYLELEEDAVGTAVSIEHVSAAKVGDVIKVSATVTDYEKNVITCNISVYAASGDLIATGTTKQKVVNKQRFKEKMGLVE